MGTESHDWHLHLAYGQWVALPASGPRPSARYKHAAAVADEKLYITGGTRNGRYLSDVQVFDLRNLTWSTIKVSTEPSADKTENNSSHEGLLPISGHNMIKWGNKLLLLAGHLKNISESVTVRFIDLESHLCGVVETSGTVPVARGGQSVSLVGSRLIMFGGEDRQRRLMNDVHVLDLETFTWNVLETTQTPPAPRFDHTTAVHAERYLLVFGGCSHSIFFNDLHVLDLETMEWSQPQIQGDLVTPRAGHAGITIDENWYIVGGGDNRSGSPETLVLNMSNLVLSILTSVKERDPLASEGLSVSSASLDGEKLLVAFGGYNGKYNNEVFVMRPKPRNSLNPKIFQSPAAAAAAASVTAAYALTKSGKLDYVEKEDSSKVDLSVDTNALREGNKMLESSVAETAAENSALKAKLDEKNSTYAELSKELHSVQGQLVAERSRCATLEAHIAEIQKMLVSMQSIDEEVKVLRRQKSEFDHDMEVAAVAQRQSSGGVWRWIAG
ncbi:hypothetical protein RJ640_021100 [Escallonia rubra]|uniref:Acyl-CoA-binding domain-containing protein n=1 Tax=Escallonia rubra TaxID=112253 RepID=A0AA88U563_9ASTE|nr:hypothetical protein RJ640_021100 [Escallonia rubra]